MAFTTAELIVALATGYGTLGIGAAILFLGFGLERVAPSAVGAYGFRPLLIPGLVLLWPLVILRWIKPANPG